MRAMADDGSDTTDEPLVSRRMQGGALSIHANHVSLERSSASTFEDNRIPVGEIRGVGLTPGILTGHVQVRQAGVEPVAVGFLSSRRREHALLYPASAEAVLSGPATPPRASGARPGERGLNRPSGSGHAATVGTGESIAADRPIDGENLVAHRQESPLLALR